jgi:phospholipase C
MWNNGKVDKWNVARDPGFGMMSWTRNDLPYYYTLLDHFTVGDQYFQSTFTCTDPNRLHFFSGSNGLSVGQKAVLDNGSEDVGFNWTTMAEVLQAANITWKVYQETGAFFFRRFMLIFLQLEVSFSTLLLYLLLYIFLYLPFFKFYF